MKSSNTPPCIWWEFDGTNWTVCVETTARFGVTFKKAEPPTSEQAKQWQAVLRKLAKHVDKEVGATIQGFSQAFEKAFKNPQESLLAPKVSK